MFKDRPEWSQEEIDYVIKNFNHMSNGEMSKHIERNKKAIQVKLSKMGYKREKDSYCNKEYFLHIDNAEKAYWLGFIYADGNIYTSKYDNTSYAFSIELSEKDISHLDKLNKCMESTYPIKKRTKKLSGSDKEYCMCSLRIYSKDIVENLKLWGIAENKSMTIKFPSLPDDLISHFIRGYFDGDGSIGIEKRSKQLRCNFSSGSLEFLNSIGEELKKNHIDFYIGKSAPSSNCYQLGITGRNSHINFFNYIYKDDSIFLERKHNFYIANEQLLQYIRKGWDKSK